MIFYKQTFLTTNAQIYVPASSSIHGAEVSSFKRGNVEVDLPCILYSIMPTTGSSNTAPRALDITEVVNTNRWHSEGVIEDLVLLRIFLVPDAATTGSAACPYATCTSQRHVISLLNSITLNDESYHVYIERARTITEGQTATARSVPSTQGVPQLGPIISDQHQNHRTIA